MTRIERETMIERRRYIYTYFSWGQPDNADEFPPFCKFELITKPTMM